MCMLLLIPGIVYDFVQHVPPDLQAPRCSIGSPLESSHTDEGAHDLDIMHQFGNATLICRQSAGMCCAEDGLRGAFDLQIAAGEEEADVAAVAAAQPALLLADVPPNLVHSQDVRTDCTILTSVVTLMSASTLTSFNLGRVRSGACRDHIQTIGGVLCRGGACGRGGMGCRLTVKPPFRPDCATCWPTQPSTGTPTWVFEAVTTPA